VDIGKYDNLVERNSILADLSRASQ
jgi:hypothetical protein